MSYTCRGCGGTCCTGVGSEPCTCPPPAERGSLFLELEGSAHGKHCTLPDCEGECLITVTLEWGALEAFYEAARRGSVMKPGTAGEQTGLDLIQRIIAEAKKRSGT